MLTGFSMDLGEILRLCGNMKLDYLDRPIVQMHRKTYARDGEDGALLDWQGAKE